jgi:hypothetical protein
MTENGTRRRMRHLGARAIEMRVCTGSAAEEAHLYLRVFCGDRRGVRSRKPLNLRTFKIGITKSVAGRHASYGRDGGTMAFHVRCSDRVQVASVEAFLKFELRQKVYASREYLDAASVAEMMGVALQPGSYASYMDLADMLFTHMLARLNATWPDPRRVPVYAKVVRPRAFPATADAGKKPFETYAYAGAQIRRSRQFASDAVTCR